MFSINKGATLLNNLKTKESVIEDNMTIRYRRYKSNERT